VLSLLLVFLENTLDFKNLISARDTISIFIILKHILLLHSFFESIIAETSQVAYFMKPQY
jgi:hypothetical protein